MARVTASGLLEKQNSGRQWTLRCLWHDDLGAYTKKQSRSHLSPIPSLRALWDISSLGLLPVPVRFVPGILEAPCLL